MYKVTSRIRVSALFPDTCVRWNPTRQEHMMMISMQADIGDCNSARTRCLESLYYILWQAHHRGQMARYFSSYIISFMTALPQPRLLQKLISIYILIVKMFNFVHSIVFDTTLFLVFFLRESKLCRNYSWVYACILVKIICFCARKEVASSQKLATAHFFFCLPK